MSNEPKSTELVAVENAVVSMNSLTAGLADLSKRFKGVVYDVTTREGMAEAKAARREIATPRIEVERIRKAAKAPILDLGRKLDATAASITKELAALEDPIAAQILKEENRIEAERLEKVRREEQRVSDITARVHGMRNAVNVALRAKTSAELVRILADLQAVVVDPELFAEYLDSAKVAKAEGIAEIEKIQADLVAREAEAEQLRKDREELDRQRAEQAERDRVRQEAEAKQRQRTQEIQRRIDWLRGNQSFSAISSPTLIQQNLHEIQTVSITDDEYEEFTQQALDQRADTVKRLTVILEAARAVQAEQDRLTAQREEQAAEQRRLDAQREEQEAKERAAQAERDRVEQAEANAKAEREREAKAQEERNFKPTLDEILQVLAKHYARDVAVVDGWLLSSYGAKKSKKAA